MLGTAVDAVGVFGQIGGVHTQHSGKFAGGGSGGFAGVARYPHHGAAVGAADVDRFGAGVQGKALGQAAQLLQDAQRQADAIVAEGKAAAEAEHARRLRDANAETSALAREMCEKLLARNLTQQDDARLLDDLLQKAGDSNGK